eukprot:6248658-Amphidinium_carterae.1
MSLRKEVPSLARLGTLALRWLSKLTTLALRSMTRLCLRKEVPSLARLGTFGSEISILALRSNV